MNIPPIIIYLFVGGWALFILLIIISRKSGSKMGPQRYEGDRTAVAQVYNFIYVDDINGKTEDAYPLEYSKKGKGVLASNVEIIFLEPGNYHITAHGVTYQKTPAVVTAELEAGKYYCLGANEDGLYLTERPYEWTQRS